MRSADVTLVALQINLEVTGPNEFLAVATNKVGPVKATFKGKVRLTDLDPPNGYKISGEGEGGVKLSQQDPSTTLGMTSY